MNGNLEFKVVPPRHGIAWLINSFALLRLQLARLFFIAVVLQFLVTLTQVDLVGVVFILAMPGLSAGMLEVLRRVSRGDRPPTFCLFVPLASGSHTPRLVLLGGIVFAVGAACILLVMGGNEATLEPDIMERINQGDATALELIDPLMLQRMLMALMLGVTVSGTLSFFSIPLIWFANMPLGGALKTGVSALMANWKAFLVLGLGLFALGIPVVALLGMLFSLGGGAIAIVGVLILMLSFQLLVFATQYCSYMDIFPASESEKVSGESGGNDEADRDDEGDDDSQLIA